MHLFHIHFPLLENFLWSCYNVCSQLVDSICVLGCEQPLDDLLHVDQAFVIYLSGYAFVSPFVPSIDCLGGSAIREAFFKYCMTVLPCLLYVD